MLERTSRCGVSPAQHGRRMSAESESKPSPDSEPATRSRTHSKTFANPGSDLHAGTGQEARAADRGEHLKNSARVMSGGEASPRQSAKRGTLLSWRSVEKAIAVLLRSCNMSARLLPLALASPDAIRRHRSSRLRVV